MECIFIYIGVKGINANVRKRTFFYERKNNVITTAQIMSRVTVMYIDIVSINIAVKILLTKTLVPLSIRVLSSLYVLRTINNISTSLYHSRYILVRYVQQIKGYPLGMLLSSLVYCCTILSNK